MWIVRELGEDHSSVAPLPSKAIVVELSKPDWGRLVPTENCTVICAAELEKTTSPGSGVGVALTTTSKRAELPAALTVTKALRR